MVITFVSSACPLQCAKDLDNKRILKQRVEAFQLIKSIEEGSGWSNHPCSKMWANHVEALKVYYNIMVRECISRGFENNMPLYDINENEFSVIRTYFDGVRTYLEPTQGKTFPWFFGWQPFIYSHRCALIRKKPDYYGPKFWDSECEKYINYGYIWPTHLPPTVLEYFDFSMITPFGAGTPAQYRFSREEVYAWSQNHLINPKTGRPIKQGGPMYKDYEKAYKFYFST
jgi:hypothetical protein